MTNTGATTNSNNGGSGIFRTNRQH
jgi:hypothetical protein